MFQIDLRQSVSQLSSAQRQLLLDLHNQARSEVSPTAANMEEMVSDRLNIIINDN